MKNYNNLQLIIHAPNVHCGGGGALLMDLLRSAHNGIRAKFLIDDRMMPQIDEKYLHNVIFIKPTILGRLRAEWWLKVNSRGTPILAFGNLPPIYKNHSKVFLFIQNKYLITRQSLSAFPYLVQLRMHIERMWLSLFSSNVDLFIVQTMSMKNILTMDKSISNGKVAVLPFMSLDFDAFKASNKNKSNTIFMYPASADPHKNHKNLILSWIELAKDGVFPELVLTLDSQRSVGLLSWINEQRDLFNLKITNHERLKDEEINLYLSKSSALIYPSTFESFGIPLVVASRLGVPIISSELDFVRDVSTPIETFDPNSPVSIARAIKRFIGINETIKNILNANDFYREIIQIDLNVKGAN